MIETETLTAIFTPIRVVYVLFVVFAWSRAYQRWRERVFTTKDLIFWSLIWASALTLIFTPGKSEFLARALGVDRGADAVFGLGILVLFYSVYRLYAKIDNLDKNLTKLVRAIALNEERKARKD